MKNQNNPQSLSENPITGTVPPPIYTPKNIDQIQLPTPTNNKNKLTFMAIMFLISMLVAAYLITFNIKNSGGVHLSKPDQTSKITSQTESAHVECKKYLNERLGWSITCPDGWLIDDHKVLTNLPGRGTPEWNNSTGMVTLWNKNNPGQTLDFRFLETEEKLTTIIENYKAFEWITTQKIQLPTAPAAVYKITHNPKDGDDSEYKQPTIEYLIEYPRSLFKILKVVFPDTPEFNEVFSSFRLLNNKYDISLWDEIHDTNFDYTIKYPLGWEPRMFDYKAQETHNNLMWLNANKIGLISLKLESFSESNSAKLPGVNKSETQINGIPASLYTYTLHPGATTKTYEIKIKDTPITIALTATKPEHIAGMDEIVNTFLLSE